MQFDSNLFTSNDSTVNNKRNSTSSMREEILKRPKSTENTKNGTAKITKYFSKLQTMGGETSTPLINQTRPEQDPQTSRQPRPMTDREKEIVKKMEERRHKEMETYRTGYPDKWDRADLRDNFLFYTNKVKCRPDGMLIDKIHKCWWGKYEKLEMLHGYIQWLFPLREGGMNWQAQELQMHEAKKISADTEAMARLVLSYRMMLDFYGIELIDEVTGEVRRSPGWKARFDNLNIRAHNYLRITRILKSLGELNLEHYKQPLVQFFLNECLLCQTLPNIRDSCTTYWLETVKDEEERNVLTKFVEEHTSPEDKYMVRPW